MNSSLLNKVTGLQILDNVHFFCFVDTDKAMYFLRFGLRLLKRE